ncbi:ATP-dependent RNA helicase [Enterocytozoon bieneusi H348]|nr:ATP-dependent RNA helicase [Enterocytozoon bieneusi H348]|eukprot:XP_002651944.1 ATP-dependent RNA helicase [Enterocytozoon bieneusi H348]
MLSRKINLDGRVEITTPNENTHAKDRDMVVVDEFDRILEETSCAERFDVWSRVRGTRVYFLHSTDDPSRIEHHQLSPI